MSNLNEALESVRRVRQQRAEQADPLAAVQAVRARREAEENPPPPRVLTLAQQQEMFQQQANAASALGQGFRQRGQGLIDASAAFGAEIGLISPEQADRIKVDIFKQREEFVRTMEDEGMTREQAEAFAFAGEMIPEFAIPGLGTRKLWTTVLGNIGLGGLMAGTTVTEEDGQRVQNMALGSLFGGLVGGVQGFGLKFKNGVGASVREAMESPVVRARREIMDEMGLRYTLGNVTGSESLIALEGLARGGAKRTFLFEQAEDVVRHFRQRISSIRGGSGSRFSQSRQIRRMLDDEMGALRDVRQDAWDKGLFAVARQAGDRKLVLPRQLLAAVSEYIDDAANVRRNPGSAEVSQRFLKFRDDITRMINEGGATADELNDLLIGINSIGAGRTGIYTEGAAELASGDAARLKNALFDDIGVADDADPAVQSLLAVRHTYESISESMRELGDSAVMQLFGGQKLPGPRQLMRFIDELDPEEQRFAMSILRDHDPQALRGIRAEALDAAMQRSLRENAPAMVNKFDVDAFTNEVGEMVRKGFIDETEAAQMHRAANGLRLILNRVEGPLARLPVMPEDISINLVSQNPGFLARLITRIATGSSLDTLFFTEAGREALLTVSRARANPARLNAAVATLIGLTSDDGDDDQIPLTQREVNEQIQRQQALQP